MIPVVIACAIMTGTLHSQNAAGKSDTHRQLLKHVEEAYYRYYKNPINISVNDAGVVELKGMVRTYWDRLNIFANISKVEGVTRIIENLEVDTETVPDDIIRDNILNQYRSTRLIEQPEKISVAVTRGLVILTGTVSFSNESSAAEQIAGTNKGVKSVDNELEVLPPVKAESDSNLTYIVKDVLLDQFSASSKNVQVKVADGIVTLTGTVESLWSEQNIVKQVHGILGVKDVLDQLKIEPEMM
jgi:osmotically-inducible protein OsmY